MAVTFTYRTHRLELFDHPYNETSRNERAVEVAIAQHWLGTAVGDGLEVGNVLGHYGITGHRVVDLHEQAEGVDNIDARTIEGCYDWLVSISTVEHVGWDQPQRDHEAAPQAFRHLQSLLAPGGRMLVTVPMGYNPPLDRWLLTTEPCDHAVTYHRDGDTWHATRTPHPLPYGPTANSVWIGEFHAR